MKSYQVVLLFLLSVLTFSCSDDFTNYGAGVQPTTDQIVIGTDTFHLSTKNVYIDSIFSKPDSFLLGAFYNDKYGSTRADVLAQINCPVGFRFPAGSVPDSARLVLFYRSWFGDKFSPIDVNVYEMNKKTFSYTELYPTNLNALDYSDVSESNLLGRRIITAKDTMNNRKDSTAISIPLSADFTSRFFNSANYTSEAVFLDAFKGLYITTNFGSATMLNISNIGVKYYYHYTYKAPGVDTLVAVSNMLVFPANQEVRQVNRFLHPDRVVMVKERDSVNYVASPANIYTSVSLPLARMKAKMDARLNFANKTKVVNNAILKVEATEIDDASQTMPLVSHMLLIKNSAIKDFFDKKKLPSDTCAILSEIQYSKNQTSGKYDYYYAYDLAALLANERKLNPNKLEESMCLIPVSVTYSSTSSGAKVYSSVKQQYQLSGVTIRSGKNKKNPMKINLVYSGF